MRTTARLRAALQSERLAEQGALQAVEGRCQDLGAVGLVLLPPPVDERELRPRQIAGQQDERDRARLLAEGGARVPGDFLHPAVAEASQQRLTLLPPEEAGNQRPLLGEVVIGCGRRP